MIFEGSNTLFNTGTKIKDKEGLRIVRSCLPYPNRGFSQPWSTQSQFLVNPKSTNIVSHNN